MKRKLLTRFILLFLGVSIFFILFQTYNIRKMAINLSKSEAFRISELVKDGLTSHMVNGTMDKRGIFIDEVTSKKDIKALWIIRGPKVVDQFGQGNVYEKPRDEIDKKVLQSGKIYSKLIDPFGSDETIVRVTIPYKATVTNNINCLQCHNVAKDDVLGAISVELDISKIKQMGKDTLFTVLLVTIFLIFIIVFLTNSILKPYIDTFLRIGDSIKKSTDGKFENIHKPKGLIKGKEVDKLVDNYNSFILMLKNSFDDIYTKLKIFTGDNNRTSDNSFLNLKDIIDNLSELYTFKKQIDIDETSHEIYDRLAQILKNRFNIKHFNFTLYDSDNQTMKVVLKEGDEIKECDKSSNFDLCRAYKISQDIYSVSHHKACKCFKDKGFHYCIPLQLMDHITLVIRCVVETQEEFDTLKNYHIIYIKKYLQEAIPNLKIKYIVDELNESNYKDALTGLYNRKFFDQEIDILINLAQREEFSIGVLMLDMDHFKAVNDEYGHDVGDRVLQMLSSIIKENIRESDVAIRMGGEEFLLLLVNIDENNTIKVANKIRQKVATSAIKLKNGDDFYKTVSTGVSMFPDDSTNIFQVVKNADIALYNAKESGRDKVVRFTKSMSSTIDIF